MESKTIEKESLSEKPGKENFVKSNVFKRIIFSIFMIVSFCFILQSKNMIILLIFLIRWLGIFEIMRLSTIKSICPEIYFFCYSIMPCGDILISYYSRINYNKTILDISNRISLFAAFLIYMSSVFIFIIRLKKNNLKNAFTLFSYANIVLFLISIPLYESVKLLVNYGRFWWFFTTILVISNDIFAYICGKIFGRTQLISLSPKKTKEGYWGAYVLTLLFGYSLILFKEKYNYLYDEGEAVNFGETVCFKFFSIPSIYIHAFSFIAFAGLAAPFGGFFASAFKRMMKIKDFSSTIPGHGGILDRMDCQIAMACFARIYIKTFVVGFKKPVKKISEHILKKYTKNEIFEIVKILSKSLSKAN